MKKIILSLAAFTLLSFGAFSQAPESFKYQAVVRDAGNLVLTNQAVGVQLTIQQGSIGGTVVYTETFAPTTNAYGLVNLEIGTGTTTDDFSAIDWSNGPYFIETAIDASGGTSYVVMGTSQLMSVPYALHANTAGSVANDQVDDADADPTNEVNTSVVLNGTNLETTDAGGTIITDLSSLQDGVTDADADPTNEVNTSVVLNGTNLETTDAGGTIITDLSPLQDGVTDADADPTNEVNTSVVLNGTNLETTDAGGTIITDLSPLQDGVTDADADPTNELQDWSTLPGIPADIADGDDAGDTDWTISGTDQYSAVTGNVGIGTTTPANKLDVNGVITVSESPNDEMVINNDDVWQHSSGDQDFGDGGDHFMVASREGSGESAGIYGDGDHVTIWSPGDGAPGQPTALLYVNDEDSYDGATDSDPFNNTALQAYLNTAGNWVAASDKNRKENIQELDGVLQKLMKINGYTYNFKLAPVEIEKGDQKVTTYGVIAQEVIKEFPELVDVAADGSHYVCYTELIPILLEGVQEQQEMIQDLQEENDELRSRLEAIEARLSAAGL